MCKAAVPHTEWSKFLRDFSERHAGEFVSIETHDLKTAETVRSRFERFEGVELDLEDRNNERINVLVRDDQRQIKHILFRPSDVTLELPNEGGDEGLRIISINTVTTLRFRVDLEGVA
jgi:hypothetical protein